MQIYKNPFQVAADATEKTAKAAATGDKAAAMFTHRTHAERHGTTNAAAVWLSYICNGLSGLASGTMIGFAIYKTAEPINLYFALIAAFIFSPALVLLIEAIKRHTAKETIINAIQYRRFSFGLAAVAVLFSAASIVSSWYGAKMLPELTAEPPRLVNIDSLQTAFDAKISEANILHTYKPTKTLTKQGAQLIAAIQAEKMQVIENARTKNDNATRGKSEAIKADSFLLAGIAIAVELFFFLCLGFSINFYWRCYLEQVSEQAEQLPTPTPIEPTGATTVEQVTSSEGHQAPKAQQIGFVIYEANENRTNENRTIQPGNRVCMNCEKEYTPRHHKQKYCSDACRVCAWEKKAGRKLSL